MSAPAPRVRMNRQNYEKIQLAEMDVRNAQRALARAKERLKKTREEVFHADDTIIEFPVLEP